MPRRVFHVCHILPEGRAYHGLNGYTEIAQTLLWGLQALGHEASYGRNSTRAGAVNLVLGAQMLAEEQLDELPRGTVIYNLEQMAKVPLERIRPVMRKLAQRFAVWDYSEANLERWQALGRKARYVKLGWAPVLERIARAERQDIEVLLYGIPSEERLRIFYAVAAPGIACVFACGLYGEDRDGLVSRSKLVLNASAYTTSRIFEIARVSYLLANAKAVITDLRPDTVIEPDIREAVVGSSAERIVADCLRLLDDERKRRELEEHGREVFRARDIRAIVQAALQE